MRINVVCVTRGISLNPCRVVRRFEWDDEVWCSSSGGHLDISIILSLCRHHPYVSVTEAPDALRDVD